MKTNASFVSRPTLMRASLAAVLVTLAGSAAEARPVVGEFPIIARAMENCGADVATLCSGVVPGGGRIAQCLSDNRDRLSAPCADTVERGATFKNAFFACYADAQRHCADVEIGGGRVAACLKKSDISPVCRDAIAQAESARVR